MRLVLPRPCGSHDSAAPQRRLDCSAHVNVAIFHPVLAAGIVFGTIDGTVCLGEPRVTPRPRAGAEAEAGAGEVAAAAAPGRAEPRAGGAWGAFRAHGELLPPAQPV